MTSTVSTSAPAGVLGQGTAGARPYAGAAVRSAAVTPHAAGRWTGVPTAGLRDVFAGVPATPRGESTARFHAQDHFDDGTTLGSPPSSRPQS